MHFVYMYMKCGQTSQCSVNSCFKELSSTENIHTCNLSGTPSVSSFVFIQRRCHVNVWCSHAVLHCELVVPCTTTAAGMKVLHKIFPQGIITGSLPPSCLPTPPLSSRRKQRTPEHCPPLPLPSIPHPLWPSPGGCVTTFMLYSSFHIQSNTYVHDI